jgi:hypothetical protein
MRALAKEGGMHGVQPGVERRMSILEERNVEGRGPNYRTRAHVGWKQAIGHVLALRANQSCARERSESALKHSATFY